MGRYLRDVYKRQDEIAVGRLVNVPQRHAIQFLKQLNPKVLNRPIGDDAVSYTHLVVAAAGKTENRRTDAHDGLQMVRKPVEVLEIGVCTGVDFTVPVGVGMEDVYKRQVLDDVDLKAFAGTVSDGSITSDGYSSCVKLHGDREVEKIMTRALSLIHI